MLDVNQIIPTVDKVFQTRVLTENRGRSNTYTARCLAYCLFREAGYSYPAIGYMFNRDHSCIIKQVKKYQDDSRLIKLKAMLDMP
jgi:chromosomal replication initiation ATPase DnaA